jgi:hypothetical protein
MSVRQRHDQDGDLLCGACLLPILPGHLYLVVYQRDAVDEDASTMVHLRHFATSNELGNFIELPYQDTEP